MTVNVSVHARTPGSVQEPEVRPYIYIYPQHGGKFFNFCLFIDFFIHEVNKTLNLWILGFINNRDFYVHQCISLQEYIGISIFTHTILPPPPCDTQLPLKY